LGNFIDLAGRKFGNLTILRRDECKSHNIKWICKCDCGNVCSVAGVHLKSGHTKSCGCIHKKLLSKRVKTHGASKTRLYSIWSGMKDRCNNPNSFAFLNYGDRGISVCDDWSNNFNCFKEWSINNGYAENLTLDRKDNNGNYCPNNCRWATRKEQSRNTRRNVLVEINGFTQCLNDWIKTNGINRSTFNDRYYIRNWPLKKALTYPVKNKKIGRRK